MISATVRSSFGSGGKIRAATDIGGGPSWPVSAWMPPPEREPLLPLWYSIFRCQLADCKEIP